MDQDQNLQLNKLKSKATKITSRCRSTRQSQMIDVELSQPIFETRLIDEVDECANFGRRVLQVFGKRDPENAQLIYQCVENQLETYKRLLHEETFPFVIQTLSKTFVLSMRHTFPLCVFSWQLLGLWFLWHVNFFLFVAGFLVFAIWGFAEWEYLNDQMIQNRQIYQRISSMWCVLDQKARSRSMTCQQLNALLQQKLRMRALHIPFWFDEMMLDDVKHEKDGESPPRDNESFTEQDIKD